MDSVIDIAAARALVSDADLWPRVRAFLWDFAPQIDGSWLEGVSGIESLDADVASSPRVRLHILQSLGVEPCFYAFPEKDFSRLALLDGPTLLSISRWLGALSCVQSLRSVTKGAEVRALKAALPGVYPEVFAFTAYFPGIGGSDVSGKDAQSLGIEILLGLVSGLPEPLQARVKMKLPKGICEFDSSQEGDGRKKPEADARFVKKLLKLKFPEAYKLCC